MKKVLISLSALALLGSSSAALAATVPAVSATNPAANAVAAKEAAKLAKKAAAAKAKAAKLARAAAAARAKADANPGNAKLAALAAKAEQQAAAAEAEASSYEAAAAAASSGDLAAANAAVAATSAAASPAASALASASFEASVEIMDDDFEEVEEVKASEPEGPSKAERRAMIAAALDKALAKARAAREGKSEQVITKAAEKAPSYAAFKKSQEMEGALDKASTEAKAFALLSAKAKEAKEQLDSDKEALDAIKVSGEGQDKLDATKLGEKIKKFAATKGKLEELNDAAKAASSLVDLGKEQQEAIASALLSYNIGYTANRALENAQQLEKTEAAKTAAADKAEGSAEKNRLKELQEQNKSWLLSEVKDASGKLVSETKLADAAGATSKYQPADIAFYGPKSEESEAEGEEGNENNGAENGEILAANVNLSAALAPRSGGEEGAVVDNNNENNSENNNENNKENNNAPNVENQKDQEYAANKSLLFKITGEIAKKSPAEGKHERKTDEEIKAITEASAALALLKRLAATPKVEGAEEVVAMSVRTANTTDDTVISSTTATTVTGSETPGAEISEDTTPPGKSSSSSGANNTEGTTGSEDQNSSSSGSSGTNIDSSTGTGTSPSGSSVSGGSGVSASPAGGASNTSPAESTPAAPAPAKQEGESESESVGSEDGENQELDAVQEEADGIGNLADAIEDGGKALLDSQAKEYAASLKYEELAEAEAKKLNEDLDQE